MSEFSLTVEVVPVLLTSIDPIAAEFERQFERLTRQGYAGMPMDAIRRQDDVVLRFDLPGVEPDSIDLTVDQGVLTVSARREEEYAEDDRLVTRERPMGSFTRRVYLSEHLDADAISAAYENGVLAVRIPLIEKAKPRKIKILANGRKALKS
jgi:HSP20 family protein